MNCRFVMLRLLLLAFGLFSHAATCAPHLEQLTKATLWERLEFRVLDLPSVSNPFDPEVAKVDATLELPSGRSVVIPAFYYQDYRRTLIGGREQLAIKGAPEWRIRYTPTEPGLHKMDVTFSNLSQGQPDLTISTNFTATPNPQTTKRTGYVKIAEGRQYLTTSDGHPLKLIGHNVCWHHTRGTYDYDDWFSAMAKAGENFARLWMWPHAFGLETDKDSLNRYRLDRAWQLDYVMDLAEQNGLYILLCLDYHGMFESKPDFWGGNNYWVSNPYNVTNGGPCLNQNGFFSNADARRIYQKRLRYLVARYGASPNLLAWEFFNEIDNVYSYLKPADVAAWHGVMGDWLRANDPFDHLVTTSLTGSSDRPEIWNLPQLDFSAYHSYSEPGPASRLAHVSQDFLKRYRKPVMIGEYGTDWRGWNRSNDPFLRGWRQALWGGALGGSMGSSMSWWWENIHSENVYPVFTAMRTLLDNTGWGSGSWTNIGFKTTGRPPARVGPPLPGNEPFTATLAPGGGWGTKPSGQLAVANPESAGYAASTLNAFVHGTAHSELRVPLRINAWLANEAELVLHLNSVSQGAILSVRGNGRELFRTNLVNLDGGTGVNNEYNVDFKVALPTGLQTIDVLNAGSDWFYLDWVRLSGVLPSSYVDGWQPSPESVGMQGPRESLVYVVAPNASFPSSATNAVLPVRRSQTITLTNWTEGPFVADWYTPANGESAGRSEAVSTDGLLTLTMPDFTEDLVGIIYPPSSLRSEGHSTNGFRFRLESEPNGIYVIEASDDLSSWRSFSAATNATGTMVFLDPELTSNQARFFRARKVEFPKPN